MSFAHRVVAAIPLLLVASCSTPSSVETTPNGATTTEASVTTTSEASVPSTSETSVAETTSPPPSCPNTHGGVCLGSLEAGSYTTIAFQPEITYTVPAGWTNLEDLPGNFLLQKEDDPRYLGIYQNVRAPAECDEVWADGVEGSVQDLLDWYAAHPGLIVSEPEDVTIGGLDGVWIDVSMDPAWDVTCPYSEGQPVVPIIIGNGISSLHHVILPGFEERLYLLVWNEGNVTIEVGSEGQSLGDWLEELSPIIESIQFEN